MPKKLKNKPKGTEIKAIPKKKMLSYPGNEKAETAMLREAISQFIQPSDLIPTEIRAIMQTLLPSTRNLQHLKSSFQNEDRPLKDLCKDVTRLASMEHVSITSDKSIKYSQHFIDTFDTYEEDLLENMDDLEQKTESNDDEKLAHLSEEDTDDESVDDISFNFNIESSVDLTNDPSANAIGVMNVERMVQEAIEKYMLDQKSEDYHKSEEMLTAEQKIMSLENAIEQLARLNSKIMDQNCILKDAITCHGENVTLLTKANEALNKDIVIYKQNMEDLSSFAKQIDTNLTRAKDDERTRNKNAHAQFEQDFDRKVKQFEQELEAKKNKIGGKQESTYVQAIRSKTKDEIIKFKKELSKQCIIHSKATHDQHQTFVTKMKATADKFTKEMDDIKTQAQSLVDSVGTYVQ